MNTTDIAARPLQHPAHSHPLRRAPVPVLIEVPLVRVASLRADRLGMSRRRRRLRREVRVAGTALLVVVSATWLVAGVLGGVFPRPGESSAVPPPVVSLSPELEPVLSAPGLEGDGPVVRPAGYLLPEGADEVTEEPAHAGS